MRDAVVVSTPGNLYDGKTVYHIDRAYRSLNEEFYQQFTFEHPYVYLENEFEMKSGLKQDQEMVLRILFREPVKRVGQTEHDMLFSFYQLQPRTVYEGALPDAEIVHFEGHHLAIRLAQNHIAHFYRTRGWQVTTPLPSQVQGHLRIQRGPFHLLNIGLLLQHLEERGEYDATQLTFKHKDSLSEEL